MLKIMDRYPYKVPFKGGYEKFRPKVIITLAIPPVGIILLETIHVHSLGELTNITSMN